MILFILYLQANKWIKYKFASNCKIGISGIEKSQNEKLDKSYHWRTVAIRQKLIVILGFLGKPAKSSGAVTSSHHWESSPENQKSAPHLLKNLPFFSTNAKETSLKWKNNGPRSEDFIFFMFSSSKKPRRGAAPLQNKQSASFSVKVSSVNLFIFSFSSVHRFSPFTKTLSLHKLGPRCLLPPYPSPKSFEFLLQPAK